jgi:hypothetical protein
MKFGRRRESEGAGWESGDEIAIYTKWQYGHRKAWWTQVNLPSWASAKPDILNRVHNAKPSDIVTIVLIGHGKIKACSSGAFAKAFIETLGLMRDEEIWTPGKQKQKLGDDLGVDNPWVPELRRSQNNVEHVGGIKTRNGAS